MTSTDTDTSPTKRTRKRNRPGSRSKAPTTAERLGKPCPRGGCPRFVKRLGKTHCSHVCKAVDQELERAQRICQTLGADNPLVSGMWAEIVAVSDSWSRHIELDNRLYQEARSVGITDEQYQAIKNG